MSKVIVAAFSISVDGFGAGPGQDLQNPLGVRGTELHEWFFHTAIFNQMTGHTNMAGAEGQGLGVDNDFGLRSFENVGAWILGRNMFGPVRGPWPDESWKGWWGEEPPYHVPVFVLTHYARARLEMKGGTTFHFVGDAEEALGRAKEAAGEKDVRIGGGVATIRQYLGAGKVDEMHLAVSPVVLGEGENLFTGMNLAAMGFRVVESRAGERAMHVVLRRG